MIPESKMKLIILHFFGHSSTTTVLKAKNWKSFPLKIEESIFSMTERSILPDFSGKIFRKTGRNSTRK
jgi:hypothetical protein